MITFLTKLLDIVRFTGLERLEDEPLSGQSWLESKYLEENLC